jgi:ribosome assembly protein RRB1
MSKAQRNSKRVSSDFPDAKRVSGHVTGDDGADNEKEELEFEDPFEDEYEQEYVVDGESAEAREDAARHDTTASGVAPTTAGGQRVWRAGLDPIGEDEVLEHDPTAYTLFHKLKVEWPCLSIDVLRDSLGAYRTKLPASMYMVAGSQADDAGKNKVSLLKITNLTRTTPEDEDDDDADDAEDDDNAAGSDPIVEARAFKHPGAVNRIRAMPQQPSIVATWSDAGSIHFWNTSAHSHSLDNPAEVFDGNNKAMASMLSFDGHGDEGYAMDWASLVPGRFASGCCSGKIFISQVDPSGAVAVDSSPFNVHGGASVEDIQWSPTMPDVFAAASIDGTIRMFDVRAGFRGQHMLSAKAHDSHVNVISWNPNADGAMLLSGGDDGRLRVWELSRFSTGAFDADFNYHKKPITSVRWHPHEDSVFVASSEDGLVTLWDLGLEADAEEVAREATGAAMVDYSIPPQLLFEHMGQTDVKEVHFHPQIPSLVLSTAADGIDIFKTANSDVLLPPAADGDGAAADGVAVD